MNESLDYLEDDGGCPVCHAGHVVSWDGNVGWLCDLHFTDLLGTPEHAGITR